MIAEVKQYLEQQTDQASEKLLEYREWVLEAVPDCEERFAYGMPTYRKGKNLIHLAAFKQHLGIYPGAKAIDQFEEELKKFKTSKGTIQVPMDQLDLMSKELLQAIVLWNVAQFKQAKK